MVYEYPGIQRLVEKLERERALRNKQLRENERTRPGILVESDLFGAGDDFQTLIDTLNPQPTSAAAVVGLVDSAPSFDFGTPVSKRLVLGGLEPSETVVHEINNTTPMRSPNGALQPVASSIDFDMDLLFVCLAAYTTPERVFLMHSWYFVPFKTGLRLMGRRLVKDSDLLLAQLRYHACHLREELAQRHAFILDRLMSLISCYKETRRAKELPELLHKDHQASHFCATLLGTCMSTLVSQPHCVDSLESIHHAVPILTENLDYCSTLITQGPHSRALITESQKTYIVLGPALVVGMETQFFDRAVFNFLKYDPAFEDPKYAGVRNALAQNENGFEARFLLECTVFISRSCAPNKHPRAELGQLASTHLADGVHPMFLDHVFKILTRMKSLLVSFLSSQRTTAADNGHHPRAFDGDEHAYAPETSFDDDPEFVPDPDSSSGSADSVSSLSSSPHLSPKPPTTASTTTMHQQQQHRKGPLTFNNFWCKDEPVNIVKRGPGRPPKHPKPQPLPFEDPNRALFEQKPHSYPGKKRGRKPKNYHLMLQNRDSSQQQ